MAGPPWLAGTFAAVMILIAAYSAGRLVFSRLPGRVTEYDADALHAVMGAAMAGMLMPQLNVLPHGAWTAVFALAAAWFGWHAIRGRGRDASDAGRCRYPVPHLIECAAMLYMLLPTAAQRPAQGGPRLAMPGMGSSAASAASFPALAVILALFMAGYIVWTTDRLTALARARSTEAAPYATRNYPPEAAVAQARRPTALAPVTSAAATRPGSPVGRAMLAPRLAACAKIAMSLTMGYMLILMV
jgi:hypothetical protein